MKSLLLNIVTFFLKILGLVMVFPATPFRAWARSVVYNYVLLNEKRNWLGRLWQRRPTYDPPVRSWLLRATPPGHTKPSRTGYILRRKRDVSFALFILAVLPWMFLDDDANEDTTSRDYIQTLITGDRRHGFFARLFRKQLMNAKLKSVVYGNAFDLGDVRARYPFFNFWTTLFWNTRNTAMNFQYLWAAY